MRDGVGHHVADHYFKLPEASDGRTAWPAHGSGRNRSGFILLFKARSAFLGIALLTAVLHLRGVQNSGMKTGKRYRAVPRNLHN